MDRKGMKTKYFIGSYAAGILALALAAPAGAGEYRNQIPHSVAPCQGSGPAVWINITDVKNSRGKMRVVLYRATSEDWLEKGRWLNRIEVPARQGAMQVCMPVPSTGNYAIAIRHDTNDNNSTDISIDGGGMSNNPSINIFNLGRPSVNRTRFSIDREVKPMSIRMRYL